MTNQELVKKRWHLLEAIRDGKEIERDPGFGSRFIVIDITSILLISIPTTEFTIKKSIEDIANNAFDTLYITGNFHPGSGQRDCFIQGFIAGTKHK